MEPKRKVLADCPRCNGSGNDQSLKHAKATCPKCKGLGKIEFERTGFQSKAFEK